VFLAYTGRVLRHPKRVGASRDFVQEEIVSYRKPDERSGTYFNMRTKLCNRHRIARPLLYCSMFCLDRSIRAPLKIGPTCAGGMFDGKNRHRDSNDADGFSLIFPIGTRALTRKKDPLVEIDAVSAVGRSFAPVLEEAWRKPDAKRKSPRAGCKPMDVSADVQDAGAERALNNLSTNQIEVSVSATGSRSCGSWASAARPGCPMQDGVALSRRAGAGGAMGGEGSKRCSVQF